MSLGGTASSGPINRRAGSRRRKLDVLPLKRRAIHGVQAIEHFRGVQCVSEYLHFRTVVDTIRNCGDLDVDATVVRATVEYLGVALF